MMKIAGFIALLAALVVIGACTPSDNVDNPSSDDLFHPWRLNVPQAQLDDLKYRLEHAILPTELEDVNDWSYGTSKNFVQYMVKFWREKYDFRKREAILNEKFGSSESTESLQAPLPSGQYLTNINGANIHFLHYVSSNASAVPLVIVHGWPGSVLECVNLVPHLTSRFHIVCPSIPGYFYSDAPTKKGADTTYVAEQFAALMKRLRYGYYIAAGGDWGAEIARWIGISDSNCVGVHMNMVIAQVPIMNWSNGLWELITSARASLALMMPNWFFDAAEREHMDRMKKYALDGSGYLIQHSTSPQTTSFALSDSPIGLAAYIWDKYQLWTDLSTQSSASNGEGDSSSSKQWPLLQVHSEEFLIDTVMFYWLPNAIASSMRLYKETVPKLLTQGLPYQYKPTAISAFKDIVVMPKAWARDYLNVTQWRDHSKGGHWPSLEVPQTLARDIIDHSEFVTPLFETGFIHPIQPTDLMGLSHDEL